MNNHIARLAHAEIAVGFFHVAVGIFLTVAMGSAPLRFGIHDEETFAGVMVSLGALLLFVTGICAVVGGVMLQKRTQKGRILGMFAAFLMIVVIPLGTLVGSYGIWVLFQDSVDSEFPARS